MKKLILLASIFVLTFACGKKASEPEAPGRSEETNSVTKEVVPTTPAQQYLALMNTHRILKGLEPLKVSADIEEMAQKHSENMARGKRPHQDFSKRCVILRQKLRGNICGEVVAWGQKTPQEALDVWIKSEDHRQEIEGSRYTHTGVGHATNSEGKQYWAQLFLEI